MEETPQRKTMRLKDYDYSQNGYYFVIICTHDRQNILGNIVGEGLCALPMIELTDLGQYVEEAVIHLPKIFPQVLIDQYCIMPNHIHGVLILQNAGGHGNPPLQEIIGRFKSYTTYVYNKNQKNKPLWQRSFYDHIIRNQKELDEIRKYIQENQMKWYEDKYYTESGKV